MLCWHVFTMTQDTMFSCHRFRVSTCLTSSSLLLHSKSICPTFKHLTCCRAVCSFDLLRLCIMWRYSRAKPGRACRPSCRLAAQAQTVPFCAMAANTALAAVCLPQPQRESEAPASEGMQELHLLRASISELVACMLACQTSHSVFGALRHLFQTNQKGQVHNL